MGLFFVGCKVLNPAKMERAAAVSRLMVDPGAEVTWIDSAILERAGIEPRKQDIPFQMPNGQIITRSVGCAVPKVDRAETGDEVVFAQPGDWQLLGSRALEGLNLKGDSRAKKLVAAGPEAVATAVPPQFGQLIRVPKHSTARRGRIKTPCCRQIPIKVK